MMNKESETKPTSSDVLPPFEKLKFYTDLYKFYSEMPFKLLAAYAVASSLILAVTANFTKSLSVIGWLAGLIVAIGLFIGIWLAVVDNKYVEAFGNEIESLMKELGLSIGPNFHVTRFIFRVSVILFVLVPLGAVLLVFYFVNR